MSRRNSYEDPAFRSPNPKHFYRSRENSVWAGVCAGIANRFGWDVTLVRALTVLATIFVLGPLAFVIYIVLWMITPRTPLDARTITPEEDAFWRGVSDRPRATMGNLKYTFMDLDDRLARMERKVTSEDWRLKQQFRDLERGN